MAEERTAPDLAELTRDGIEATNRHDLDAAMSLFAPDAVMDMSDVVIGSFEGAASIRSFVEDWWGTWGDHLIELEELVDLGHGVVFSRVREEGRLMGSDGHVEQRRGWILVWVQGMIDEARAAAARLAESGG
jgi:ketosteroid isomerase-like protein